MIGADRRRRAVIVIGLGLAVGIGFGLRSADPAPADPPGAAARAGLMTAAANAADTALARLAVELERAREHARRGTALTASGAAPAPELTSAAEILAGASDEAEAARRGLLVLAGIAAAIEPAATVPALSYGGTELELIAAQLRSSADAATLFVERRHATQAVVDALAAALAALDRDDPSAALGRLAEADAPLALLEAWEQRPPLLRYWMMISADLVDAAGDIATATLGDDPVALKAAADRYAKAAEAARGADNALALALSEEGAAVTATPLRRLAAVADEADDARAALRLARLRAS
ncbi:MAG: hypothetical protein ABI458_06060 [Chloroflexota bacterium]